MQHTAVFEEQIPLTPKDMRKEIQSIDELLGQKLAAKLEGRCSRHGFVQPGTVRILSRSMGQLEKGRFTGNVLYMVQAEGAVLNPPDGTALEGQVIRKNKMGMYVNYEDAIRIIIPRDLYIGNEEYESVQIGETVQVEVKKSRFQVNDPYILSVGYFAGRAGAAPAAAAAPAVVPPAAQTETLEEALDEEEDDEGEEDEEGDEQGDEEDEEGDE